MPTASANPPGADLNASVVTDRDIQDKVAERKAASMAKLRAGLESVDADADLAALERAAETGADISVVKADPAAAAAVETHPDAAVATGEPPVAETTGDPNKVVQTAAAAVVDYFADAEDIEIEDDGGKKRRVRVPKDDVQAVKDGFMRRSDYSRKAHTLGALHTALPPNVDAATLNDVAKMIQASFTDPAYGKAVREAYVRRMEGKALTWADQQVLAQVATGAAPVIPAEEEYEDPIVAATVNKALKPFLEWQNEQKARDTQQTTRQRQDFEARQNGERLAAQIRWELSTEFPGEYSHEATNENDASIAALGKWAEENNLVERYGYTPSMFVIARQKRGAAAAPAQSVAAATIRDIKDAAQTRGNQIAAQVANRLAPGGTSMGHAPQPAATSRVGTRNKDGSRKDARQLVRESFAAAEKVAATAGR